LPAGEPDLDLGPDPGPDPDRVPRPAGLAAFDPGRRGVRVLLVVAGIVVCVSAALVWWSRPQVTAAPPVGAAAASAAGPSPTPALLVVSVTGKVNRPGLVRLPPGSRVADAIEAAGGVAAGVDLAGVNLARKVVDGEMIAIGVTPPPVAAGPGATAGGLVNLNTASPAELQTLPGIGEVLAQRIVEYRDKHGGFRAVNDLRQVEGIGDAKFQQLKDRVTV
jgi:competence protein ComEA